MIYKQVELVNGASTMVCWLGWDTPLKPGMVITLEEIPDKKWKVRAVYKPVLTTHPRSTWKVGGL